LGGRLGYMCATGSLVLFRRSFGEGNILDALMDRRGLGDSSFDEAARPAYVMFGTAAQVVGMGAGFFVFGILGLGIHSLFPGADSPSFCFLFSVSYIFRNPTPLEREFSMAHVSRTGCPQISR